MISTLARCMCTRTAPKALKATLPLWSVRTYSSQAGPTLRKAARSRAFAETLQTPSIPSTTPLTIGRGFLIGASAIGIGALCYYGAGMSNEVGALEKAAFWPDYVRDRIKTTYAYLGASVALGAGTAIAVLRSPTMIRIVSGNSMMAIIGSMAAMIGSGMLCRSLPYEPGFGAKQLSWILHSSIIGAFVAPIAFLGGSIVIRAAWCTAGLVGGMNEYHFTRLYHFLLGLSALAVCAPSEKFLNMGGPLAMGLGVVFVSQLASMFVAPATTLGVGLYAISVYGGVALFSALLLYDTQKVIKNAEHYPLYAARPYDPVNGSIGLYLDIVNIFIRLALIFSGGGNRRK